MKKFLSAFFVLAAICSSFPALAGGDPNKTENPEDKGYYELGSDVSPVVWTPYETLCQACDELANAYNAAMTSVMDLRYQIKYIERLQRKLEDQVGEERHFQALRGAATKGQSIGSGGEAESAWRMNHMMAVQDQVERLPAMREQLQRMEEMAHNMKAQLDACEKIHCRGEGNELRDGIFTGDPKIGGNGLPFEWKGPYITDCKKCQKLAERLNTLPNMARELMAKLEKAKTDKMIAEARLAQAQGESTAMGDPDAKENRDKKRDTEKRVQENEAKRDAAVREIDKLQADLDKVVQNFNETLRLYNECLRTCQPADRRTGMMIDPGRDTKTANCSYSSPQQFVIGPNSQYGTGAEMKNKVKDTAKGMAMGALGGLMGGGGGFSMGGGGMMDDRIGTESTGGGGSQKGPDTVRDPTRKLDYAVASSGPLEFGMRATYNNGQILISSKIIDSPGDGTFHTQWIEDGQSHIYMPNDYMIFSLYQDWKLTVWWTHDRWVDGQHVLHEGGEEITTGRNTKDFAVRFQGEKGVQNSIWSNSGFETATKGIQSLGTVYTLPEKAIMGVCPLQVVTHVTLPKEDPVRTVPVLGEIPLLSSLFHDGGDQKKDLQVVIKPRIISDF